MRITLLLILTIFFAGQTVYSQYVSENYYNFDNEINEILLQTDAKKVNRIIFKFKIFVQPHKKKDFKDLVEFEFLNDTIIEMSQYVRKYYWLISGGKLAEIDYDQENSVVIKDKSSFIDSAGYKVYSNMSYFRNDTVYYHIQKKIENGGKSVETIYKETSSKLDPVTTMFKTEIIGDTSYTYIYKLSTGNWELIYDKKEWKVLNNNRVIDAPTIMTEYTYETNGDITKSFTTTNSVFAYDSVGRLISVTKYFFLDFDENWYQKDVMTVKYVKR